MKYLVIGLLLLGCTPPQKGDAGDRGRDGHSTVFSITAASGCVNGGSTVVMALDVNDNGTLDVGVDANVQSATICNGVDGADGHDAPPTAFTPVQIIDPCGDAPGIWDEVMLKLQNGTLLASFSDNASGQNTRFSVITAGSYVTTDGSNCHFTVDPDLTVHW